MSSDWKSSAIYVISEAETSSVSSFILGMIIKAKSGKISERQQRKWLRRHGNIAAARQRRKRGKRAWQNGGMALAAPLYGGAQREEENRLKKYVASNRERRREISSGLQNGSLAIHVTCLTILMKRSYIYRLVLYS
jgi:hypothetical protein